MGRRESRRNAGPQVERLAESTGVHPTDLRALRLLDAAAEQPLTVGALGAQLGLSSAAVSELVDRLERAQLAQRVRDDADRRRVLVHLGPRARSFGREQLAPIAASIQRAIADAGDEELEAVKRFLTVLLAEEDPEAADDASSEPE